MKNKKFFLIISFIIISAIIMSFGFLYEENKHSKNNDINFNVSEDNSNRINCVRCIRNDISYRIGDIIEDEQLLEPLVCLYDPDNGTPIIRPISYICRPLFR